MLQDVMQEAAKLPLGGREVESRPGRWLVMARWKRAKAGHRIVYEIIQDGIFVVRILHTAMNLLGHLEEAKQT